ncbi:Tereporin-Ca1 [Mytilus coruscus]|uniref:Tereporin-Ca1 n=1 Tax=Mytilus coruscus TaxID=42192 RepID=A0A6J8BZV9_MYTCO|nr:Tereporin-Ca1 [Mytilus coruscus]
MHHTCTVVPLLLFLLTFWTTQAQVEWIVENGGVAAYGQMLTLLCKVTNCCIQDSGWVQWNYDSIDFRTLIIDVTDFRNEKYSGKKRQDGFTLVISDLNETDLNRNYSCTYGADVGAMKLLLKEEAFNRTNSSDETNEGLSTGAIVGISLAVVFVIVAAIIGWVLLRPRNIYMQASTEEVKLPETPKRDENIDWATASDMAALVVKEIVPGASVTKCKKWAARYSVMCTIVIENWTKYILVDPDSRINGGKIPSPPTVVGPGKKEMFVAHKKCTATGTYGTASWLISSTDQRAVIMWSCPYNFNHHKNRLAVGLTEKGTTKHKDWFDQMYKKESGSNLHFVREEYDNHTKTISNKGDNFEITGTMGTTHVTEAHIIVRPLTIIGLADNLKKCVEKSSSDVAD